MAKKSMFGSILSSVAKEFLKAPKVEKAPVAKRLQNKIENIPFTHVRVSIASLQKKYMRGACIDELTLDMMTDAIFNGDKNIIIPKSSMDLMEHKKKLYIQKQKDWDTLVKKKAKAREYEKTGDLEKAVLTYKDLVEFGVASPNLIINNYGHDVNRLRIVLNKLKRKEEYELFIQKHNITQ